MRNENWTEAEQMKVVWNIVDSELMENTKPRTKERKAIVDNIVRKLLRDSDFSARLKSENPEQTVYQHIQSWIGYLEKRREDKPSLVRTKS